jgi:LemA protein
VDAALLSVLIFFGVLLALLLWGIATYNKLIRLRNRAEALWAAIDVQLKRRHDLIPNLVHALEGYATHERGTLDEVTDARTQAMEAKSVADQAKAENMLTGALSRLFANVEQYPQLRAEGDFQRLEQQLADLERVIAMSRDAYNLTVQAYNNNVMTVPTNVVAWFMSFEKLEYLVAADAERAAPEVDVELPGVPSAPLPG